MSDLRHLYFDIFLVVVQGLQGYPSFPQAHAYTRMCIARYVAVYIPGRRARPAGIFDKIQCVPSPSFGGCCQCLP